MKKFSKLKSRAAPLIISNIDTDVIIPMHRYVMADKKDMHQFAFEPLRYLTDGTKNPDFILNQRRFKLSKILIVGQNFGCGSSREAAVWAIEGLGIRCIIGSSFGNIFFNNCFENSILAITLSKEIIKILVEIVYSSLKPVEFVIDLNNSQITAPSGQHWNFKIDAHRRKQLLEGLNSTSMTLKRIAEIEAFRNSDKMYRPWVYI